MFAEAAVLVVIPLVLVSCGTALTAVVVGVETESCLPGVKSLQGDLSHLILSPSLVQMILP